MLNLRVPFIEGESATSFCSRLAMRNRCRSMQEFCLDHDLSFKAIRAGHTDALSQLARLGGIDAEKLQSSALRTDGTRYFCGHSQIDFALLKIVKQIFVCPACLAADLAQLPDYGAAAPAFRTAWLLKPIMTCVEHGVALIPVDMTRRMKPYEHSDFSRRIEGFIQQLETEETKAVSRPASSLEHYLCSRLNGTPATINPHVDQMPFYAIAHASHMLGVFCQLGPKPHMKTLSDEQHWECSAVGFDLLAGGYEALQSALLDNMQRWPKGKNAASTAAFFGGLHHWLVYQKGDASYAFLRAIIRDLMVTNRPLRSGTQIYGVTTGDSHLHSVRTASEEIGVHPKRLKKLLISANLLDEEARNLSANQAAFPADAKASEVLQRVKRCIPKLAAAAYINAPPLQFDLLHKADIIKAFINSGGEIKDYGFDTQDLDAFLEQLTADIQNEIPEGLQPLQIVHAAKRANCSAVKITRLILDRKLRHLYRQPETDGFMSILVGLEELRTTLSWPTRPGLSIAQVEKQMQWSRPVITALIENGLLPARIICNPHTHMPQTIIEAADLKAFDREFIALSALAREQRQTGPMIKARLLESGVKPVFDPKGVRATFYRRKELVPVPTDQPPITAPSGMLLITDANAPVKQIHSKAMPEMLTFEGE